MPKSPLEEFLALFDEAIDYKPFLMFELGYTRVTDWMVHIIDKSGGVERKLIVTQSHNRDDAIRQAKERLGRLRMEWM